MNVNRDTLFAKNESSRVLTYMTSLAWTLKPSAGEVHAAVQALTAIGMRFRIRIRPRHKRWIESKVNTIASKILAVDTLLLT